MDTTDSAQTSATEQLPPSSVRATKRTKKASTPDHLLTVPGAAVRTLAYRAGIQIMTKEVFQTVQALLRDRVVRNAPLLVRSLGKKKKKVLVKHANGVARRPMFGFRDSA